MSGKRLDAVLVERGLASGREKAKEYILRGDVLVDGQKTVKPSALVGGDAVITCAAGETYVGRGGYKLEKALTCGGWDLTGVCALDIGASTGGFTDCMLRHGAGKVYAVDVGRGQLHPSLCADPRVYSLEGTDIRHADLTEVIPEKSIDFCSIDVAFISVTKIAESIVKFLKPGASAACLIKPQFEAGRAAVGKHGVVNDPRAHAAVLKDAAECFSSLGFTVSGCIYSPVLGGVEGNIEYFLILVYNQSGQETLFDFSKTVTDAFGELKGVDVCALL